MFYNQAVMCVSENMIVYRKQKYLADLQSHTKGRNQCFAMWNNEKVESVNYNIQKSVFEPPEEIKYYHEYNDIFLNEKQLINDKSNAIYETNL